MGTDPVLSFFESLSRPEPEKEEPDYPGTTKPKNRDGRQAVMVEKPTGEMLLDGVNPVEFLVKGIMQRFYTVGMLGAILGREAVTIRSWEHKGWLPKATYRSPTPVKQQIPDKKSMGKRLYTRSQVLCLIEGFQQHIDITKPNWAAFRAHIQNNYPKT